MRHGQAPIIGGCALERLSSLTLRNRNPIQCAPNSREFIIGFRDCFKGKFYCGYYREYPTHDWHTIAIASAKKQCGLVHRDISLWNVMIKVADDGEVTGILADWDHAGPIVSCETTEHQNFRTVGVYR